MKVLLLQDIKSLGRRYDVKNVSDGYARNFLIPKKLASPADEKALKAKSNFEKKERDLLKEYQDAAAALKDESLEFQVKVGPKGEVFGSISGEEIKKALRQRGRIFENVELNLPQSLKTLGEHSVEINFGKGVKGEAKVILETES